ncbi:MAG: hypothetical protein E6248_07610 [Clostridium sp.]|uniref:hypothetical protein n=1 Tax=Clostridium sp. TaxID=1506 RepID=UPI00290C0524|nr:hypothetical protein [Clostridium sp.]MDU5110299.1 hypothetical protein [Clostridium sp.]
MKGLKLSELILILSTLLDEQGDMPVMVGVLDREKEEMTLGNVTNVSMENFENIYYCEIS